MCLFEQFLFELQEQQHCSKLVVTVKLDNCRTRMSLYG